MEYALPTVRRERLSELVIVGGGPAGSAAAIALARAGHSATLIERTSVPTDKVCGDFLSGDSLQIIDGLGVDLSVASTIYSLRVVYQECIAVATLPFAARGLSRRVLDEALLGQAQSSGARVFRGHRIGGVDFNRDSIRLRCRSMGSIVADNVFLATGKHDLQGMKRTAKKRFGLVGLKMYYTLAHRQLEALRHHVELMLFPGGYAGLQLVEADRAILCVLLPTGRLRAVDGRWDRLLDALTDDCRHLRMRLDGARALLDQPLAISDLPYGYLHRTRRCDPPGLFRLGDQTAVIASLTGDGIALALASGSMAARAWLAGKRAPQYHRRLAACLFNQIHVASAIHQVCLSPTLQPLAVAICRIWPGAIRLLAEVTRQTFDA